MKWFSPYAALLLITVFSNCFVYASNRQAAMEMYAKSGLEKQMLDIGPAFMAGYKEYYSMARHHLDHDRQVYNSIDQLVDRAFDSVKMREAIVSGLMEKISSGDMLQILAWLSSATGDKITILEEMAGGDAGAKAAQEYARNFTKGSVTEKRVELIKDLTSLMNIVETTVGVTVSTQFALSMTTGIAKKNLSHDDVVRLYENFKANRPQNRKMIENRVYTSLLSTYRTLTDEELAEYVEFIRSEAGQKYSRVTSHFFLKAIVDGCLLLALEASGL